MAAKQYRRASLEFLNAAGTMPRDAEAWYQLGESYLAAGDFQQASVALLKATEINPKHAGAQIAVATMMAASRDMKAVEAAQKRLDAISDAEPRADLLDVRALVDIRLGLVDEAGKDLQQAVEISPGDVQAALDLTKLRLTEKDIAGAREALEAASKSNPRSSLAALLLGRFYLLTGERQRGEAEVRRALDIDPANGAALLTLAAVETSSGRPVEAEATYRRLSALPDPWYKPAHAGFLFENGRRDEAVAEFERLAKDSPEDRGARTRLVAACFSTGRTAEAERILGEALKSNPHDAEALLQRSRISIASRKYGDAENDLRQVLGFQPASAQAHFFLAKVYQARGEKLNQRQELAQALAGDPAYLPARTELAELLIASGDGQAALETMNQTPDAERQATGFLAARNWALLAVSDYAAARRGIDEGLAKARTAEFLLEDGAWRLAQKDAAGAERSIEEALKISPDSESGWEFLRRAATVAHQPGLALQQLEAAAKDRPQSAALQLLLGRWLTDAGRPDDARQALEAAKNSDRSSRKADVALAQLDLVQNRTDSARERLMQVVKEQPQNLTARILLGEIAKRSGDRAAAIAQYRAVLTVDQRSLVALNDLAFLLSKENPNEALKYAQAAGELAPDNAAVEDTLGWVCYQNGLYTSAIRYLKTAVEQGRTPLREYHLGMAYLKSGDRSRGEQIMAAAVAADPTLTTTEAR